VLFAFGLASPPGFPVNPKERGGGSESAKNNFQIPNNNQISIPKSQTFGVWFFGIGIYLLFVVCPLELGFSGLEFICFL
jgi:hypothetical protein